MAIKPGFIPERPYEPDPGSPGPDATPVIPGGSPEEDPMRQPSEIPGADPGRGPEIMPGAVPGGPLPTGPANPTA